MKAPDNWLLHTLNMHIQTDCTCATYEPSHDELTDKFPYLVSHPFVCFKKGLPRIFCHISHVITSLDKCHALVYVIPKWQTTREEFESKVRNLEYINKFKSCHCSGKDDYFLRDLFLPKQETFGAQIW